MLFEQGLADEVLLFVYPILLGKGKRFFSDGTPPSGLALTSANAVSSGVLISTYTSAGPLRTGSLDDPVASANAEVLIGAERRLLDYSSYVGL